MADSARQTLALAHGRNCRVVLPEDVVVAPRLERCTATRTGATDAVPSDLMILDLGSRTVGRIAALVEGAATLVWNGPLGAFETPPFDRGTAAVAGLTRAEKLLSVAGGGDTVAALDTAGVTDQLSYVSTAGGAFLEWLEGRELPAVPALALADGK
jgi:phosphoglycerate kinase